jgi:hypothetical protein
MSKLMPIDLRRRARSDAPYHVHNTQSHRGLVLPLKYEFFLIKLLHVHVVELTEICAIISFGLILQTWPPDVVCCNCHITSHLIN